MDANLETGAEATDNQSERPPFNEISVLFPLLTLYTAGYMGLMAAEFFLRGTLKMPSGLMAIYIALLGAYAADKEIRRWVGVAEPPRKGSLFVYLWALLYLAAFIFRTFRPEFNLSPEFGPVVLQVVGIFFGSRASKTLYGRQRKDAGGAAVETDRQTQLLALVGELGHITRAEVSERLGVSEATAKRLLQALVEQGRLEKRGEGHSVHYVMAGSSGK